MADSAAVALPPVHAGAAPGQPPGQRRETVVSVTESFIDLQRTVRRAKARLLAVAGGNDVESATQALLHVVAAEGPMRASALAASLQADLSTVSRQVSALVTGGLLERQADQCDGRASLLAVTDAGRAAIAQHEQVRQAFFDDVLAGWSDEEMRQFVQQLLRFTADYDHIHTARMKERAARSDTPSGARTRTIDLPHRTHLEEGSA